MGINFKDWHNRIASRSDLTGRLTHLTRPLATEKTSGKSFEEINFMAIDTLIKILSEKSLLEVRKMAMLLEITLLFVSKTRHYMQ